MQIDYTGMRTKCWPRYWVNSMTRLTRNPGNIDVGEDEDENNDHISQSSFIRLELKVLAVKGLVEGAHFALPERSFHAG